jgi:hypothetical protein
VRNHYRVLQGLLVLLVPPTGLPPEALVDKVEMAEHRAVSQPAMGAMVAMVALAEVLVDQLPVFKAVQAAMAALRVPLVVHLAVMAAMVPAVVLVV